MKREDLINGMIAEMDSANSWGFNWGEGFEVFAIMNKTGLDYEQVLAKLEEAGYSEDFVDIYDLEWIDGDELYDELLELCAESIYSDGYMVKGADLVELLEDWESYKDYDDLLDALDYEEYKDKITRRGFDFIKESRVDNFESAINNLGRWERGIKSEYAYMSDLRLSEENVKGRFESVEEAYEELRETVNWYALKLRGYKTSDEEFEKLKGIMANREIDCGLLDLCDCYMTNGEICEFFVNVFGFEKIENYGSFIKLEDSGDYCRVLFDFDDLFDYELVG